MKISPNHRILLCSIAVFFYSQNYAQVVTDMTEQGGGVITTTPEGALRGDEYWADGIIDDWNHILKDFETESRNNDIQDQLSTATESGYKTISIRGLNLRLPEMLDENGIDLYLLTEEGVTIYMAMDGPAYLQETDDDIIRWIRYYAYQKREYTKKMFARYSAWEPKIKNCFNYYDIPAELAEICLVESGCTYSARSSAGAVGMWQIMPETARSYGLIVGRYTDERLDPEKSLPVAAKILRDCFRKTGDWTLAAAAYNCGSGNILKHKNKGGGDWSSIRQYIPKETRQYIPSLIAIHYVWTYRDKFKL